MRTGLLIVVSIGWVTLQALAPCAQARDYTWVGPTTGGNWRDYWNWDPNVGFPGSGTDDRAIFPSTFMSSISVTGSITLLGLNPGKLQEVRIEGNSTDGDASLNFGGALWIYNRFVLTSSGGAASTIKTTGNIDITPVYGHILVNAGGPRTVDTPFLVNENYFDILSDVILGSGATGSLTNIGYSNLGILDVRARLWLKDFQQLKALGGGPGGQAKTRIASTGVLDSNGGSIQFMGGFLYGGGTIADPVSIGYTKVSPQGDSGEIGTLKIQGDTTISATTQLAIRLDDSGNCDALAIDGNVNFVGSDTTLTITGGKPGIVYKILTYTGARTGTFGASTPGYYVGYNTPGEIDVILPEPGTITMLLLGGMMLCRRPRRRIG